MFSPAKFQSALGSGGYAFKLEDSDGTPPGTSMSCITDSAFCGMGATGIASSATWGAGLGVNLNQLPGTTTPSTYTVPASASGIAYALTSLPAGTLYLIIDNAGKAFYAPVTALSGTLKWSSFVTTPWMADASVALSGAPTAATHINIQINAGTAPIPFNFCVTKLAFM
jgi:hypothetical protein